MRLDARELAAIFAGGFLGAVARAELAEALPHDPGAWPWATFVVNVAGAFLLGYFVDPAAGARCRCRPTGARSSAPASAAR